MVWRKLGLVYAPDGSRSWARSHAYIPTPLRWGEDTIRVFATFWDGERIGRVGFVDVAAQDPLKVLRVSEYPLLDVGSQGAFDDSGATASCALARDGRVILYYIGWQRGTRRPYFLFSGVSEGDGEAFSRLSQAPILDRRDGELFVRSAPFVMPYGDGYRMWYIGGADWVEIGGKQIPTYEIRVIDSNDGILWPGPGRLAVKKLDDEIGLGRPWVVRDQDCFRMWYSIRTLENRYSFGYAESTDGETWVRKDQESGLQPSPTGWDSEMVCFGAIVDIDGRRLMFYNGNDFGRTGFGVAAWE